jgi:putative ABC transport system permease protein
MEADRVSLLGDIEEERRARIRRGSGHLSTFVWQTGQILAACVYGARDALRRSPQASRDPSPGRRAWAGLVSWPDLKLSLRLLLKHPGLTLVASVGIAVGIAICAGFFAFAQSQLYPTLPLDEGDRIIGIENQNVVTRHENRNVLHDFVTWRDQMTTVVEIGAFHQMDARLQFGTRHAETVRIAAMTASGFTVARVAPLMGRFLAPDDERPDADPVLVVGYDAWRSRFAQDPSVVGQQVRIGTTIHTIVGVMPEGFKFPVNHQFWVPLRANPLAFERGAGPQLCVFGRLAPGATFASAQAELAAIGRHTASAFPQTHANLKPLVVKYTLTVTGDAEEGIEVAVLIAEVLVSLVLVVVALNLAILVYARTTYRHREIAIRTALGAGRLRIVTQLSAEALTLALVPAIAGLALAQYGVRLSLQIFHQQPVFGGAAPFWTDYSLQPATIGYVLALVVVTVGIVGVLPALRATRRSVAGNIGQLGTSVRLGRTWGVLIVAQVAIAVAALPAMVRLGLTEIRSGLTRPSYPIKEFLGLAITTEGGKDRLGHRLTELKRRLQAEPDVAGVTFAASLPGRSIARVELMGPAGNAVPTDSKPTAAGIRTFGIDSDYFNVYGVRLLAGRSFDARDSGDLTNPVIVDRSFVRAFLNDGHPLGRRFRDGARAGSGQPSPWYEIVGVTENLATNPIDHHAVPAYVFYPVAAEQVTAASLRLHVRGPAAAHLESGLPQRLHRLAAGIDPALRPGEIRPSAFIDLSESLKTRLIGQTLTLVMVTVLMLSAAGVYALMSFTVAQRRREIGIRTALGAPPYRVLQSIFSRVAVQVGSGMLVGIAGAVTLESPITSAIGWPELAGRRAIVLPAIALVMLLAGFLAAFGPARRGLRIQPTEALKTE